jgi:SAM-dependent methyltransferase
VSARGSDRREKVVETRTTGYHAFARSGIDSPPNHLATEPPVRARERLLSEQLFHDRQAAGRSLTFRLRPEALRFADEEYLGHETWIGPAFEQLGDIRDLDVLDYGCGHGMAAVVLARRGARVTAFDLAPAYVEEASRRAAANGVEIACLQADGECLPFADAVFDRVWGNAVLHHLDVEKAARELRRVLRPGGVAVFCEPWGGNPLLDWARRSLPYRGKARTAGEQPLQRRHLRVLRRHFPGLHVRGFQLLSMVRRVVPPGRLVRGLEDGDAWLLRRFPGLWQFCRYVVLTLRRSGCQGP